MAEVDERRLPFEITRALDDAGIMLEMLDPGLSLKAIGGDWLVMDRHGDELCVLPLHRVEVLDDELIATVVAGAIRRLPSHEVDQAVAALDDGRLRVIDPPEERFVYIELDDRKLAVAYRRALVRSWPDDDLDDDEPRL
jgi:hypothetical protein